MKTKIIYISGNEIFDMNDIRSAFEEVRAALSLGSDTVLFGVPVDSDDALVAAKPAAEINTNIVDSVVEPVATTTPDIDEVVIEKETKPTPRRTKSAKVVPISDAIVAPKTDTEPTQEDSSESTEGQSPVVPILSILGSKSDDDNESNKTTAPVEQADVAAETVTIGDMIADEAPEETAEKTLEELLESMTPLGEDAEKKDEPISIVDDFPEDASEEPLEKPDNDIDITLEKLATEFVENQDKIDTPIKPAARGKIGKLKNILPFKKAKHDDSGLMGDLFGWAGTAANDEDFTIPGFFK